MREIEELYTKETIRVKMRNGQVAIGNHWLEKLPGQAGLKMLLTENGISLKCDDVTTNVPFDNVVQWWEAVAQEEKAVLSEVVAQVAIEKPQLPKKRMGRPKGSKNKPK